MPESPTGPEVPNSTVEMGETATLIIREDATLTMTIVVAEKKSDSNETGETASLTIVKGGGNSDAEVGKT